MRHCLFSLVVVVVLAGLSPSVAGAQRLGAVSHAVHGGGGGGGGFRSGGGYRGYGHGGYRGYGGYGGGVQIGSPWVPLFYPYYGGYVGVGVRQAAMPPGRTFEGPDVIGIVDASAGYVFDGVVHGELTGRLRLGGELDLVARYGAYFEQTADRIDALGLGRFGFGYALVAEDAVQLRIGGSGLVYHDAAGAELGFAGQVELDVYPVEPLVLHLEASGGAVGRASMLDARATLGLQIDRGEIYVGYQVFAVDLGTPNEAVLHGPIAGVRAWIS